MGADESTTDEGLNSTSVTAGRGDGSTFSIPVIANVNTTATISINASSTTATTINSTITPSMKPTDNATLTSTNATESVPLVTTKTTPAPITVAETTKATTEGGSKDMSTTVKPKPSGGDHPGIIIVVVIVVAVAVFGIACIVSRKRGRRYSVDFASRPDETNIPLSAREPEVPADTLPYNGMETFAEPPANGQLEPEEKAEAQEEQKAESDKSVEDPPAESAAPLPDATQDEPKEDAAEKQEDPPAPVETNKEEKTDDEGAVSSKTSVESLKETNENNSNSAEFSQTGDQKMGDVFWEVPLKSPV
ncbi:unnamed protein product [Ophioblennius macclurei]